MGGSDKVGATPNSSDLYHKQPEPLQGIIHRIKGKLQVVPTRTEQDGCDIRLAKNNKVELRKLNDELGVGERIKHFFKGLISKRFLVPLLLTGIAASVVATLASNPVGWVALGITAAFALSIMAVNAYKRSIEREKEKNAQEEVFRTAQELSIENEKLKEKASELEESAHPYFDTEQGVLSRLVHGQTVVYPAVRKKINEILRKVKVLKEEFDGSKTSVEKSGLKEDSKKEILEELSRRLGGDLQKKAAEAQELAKVGNALRDMEVKRVNDEIQAIWTSHREEPVNDFV